MTSRAATTGGALLLRRIARAVLVTMTFGGIVVAVGGQGSLVDGPGVTGG